MKTPPAHNILSFKVLKTNDGSSNISSFNVLKTNDGLGGIFCKVFIWGSRRAGGTRQAKKSILTCNISDDL